MAKDLTLNLSLSDLEETLYNLLTEPNDVPLVLNDLIESTGQVVPRRIRREVKEILKGDSVGEEE